LRFIVHEVALDQKRERGQVWLKIVWQTGNGASTLTAITSISIGSVGGLRSSMLPASWTREIAATLNKEGFVAARGCKFKGENVWLQRNRWDIPTVKINGVSTNPMRWPDGSFSIQGAGAALGITT
jgi:hypothetical protein